MFGGVTGVPIIIIIIIIIIKKKKKKKSSEFVFNALLVCLCFIFYFLLYNAFFVCDDDKFKNPNGKFVRLFPMSCLAKFIQIFKGK